MRQETLAADERTIPRSGDLFLLLSRDAVAFAGHELVPQPPTERVTVRNTRVLALAFTTVASCGRAVASQMPMLPVTDTLQPIETQDARAFGQAARGVFLAAFIPYSYNRWVRHVPWAQTTLASWGANLRSSWKWDTDHFLANQFAHPYQGSFYYSAARSSNYSFWHAAPFAFAGSAMWEYFGERFPPSLNDMVNTTLGGITLGEVTYRLAGAVGTTPGGNRPGVLRRIAATALNPERAFAGALGDAEDPLGVRLPPISAHVEVGAQRLVSGSFGALGTGSSYPFVYASLSYGDPFAGDVTKPFGAFRVDMSVAGGRMAELRALGFLSDHVLDGTGPTRWQLALAMHYHYYDNRAYQGGGQGFSAGLLSDHDLGHHTRLRTEVWVTGLALTAIKSDHGPSPDSVANETARNYDYGSGVGARFLLLLTHRGRPLLDVAYQTFWVGVLSGTAQNHYYDTWSICSELPLVSNTALGARALMYHRISNYAQYPTVQRSDPQLRLFLATDW